MSYLDYGFVIWSHCKQTVDIHFFFEAVLLQKSIDRCRKWHFMIYDKQLHILARFVDTACGWLYRMR